MWIPALGPALEPAQEVIMPIIPIMPMEELIRYNPRQEEFLNRLNNISKTIREDMDTALSVWLVFGLINNHGNLNFSLSSILDSLGRMQTFCGFSLFKENLLKVLKSEMEGLKSRIQNLGFYVSGKQLDYDIRQIEVMQQCIRLVGPSCVFQTSASLYFKWKNPVAAMGTFAVGAICTRNAFNPS